MLRLPKAGPSAPGRGAPSLVPPQSQKKSMSVGSSAELVVADLAGPPVRALPAAYFAQVYPQTAVVAPLPRGGCLYATPHGPEIKTMRSASTGKLPVISLFSALCLITVTNFCSFVGVEFGGVRGKLFVMPTWPDPETGPGFTQALFAMM